ncbi:hypothetical protein MMC11_007316, partial [Xylographa trunciseda]|nr:hypothetical protein [Xylographa trunciseda]
LSKCLIASKKRTEMSTRTNTLMECSLNPNLSYNCDRPYPNCTSSLGFQFSSLWTISQLINSSCPQDWRLYDPQTATLSEAACEQIAGTSWTIYPGADIWARLTTWKFPLFQLVAIFPKPPLSFWVEAFVIFHLLGNPVSSIQDLLLKFTNCQNRAEYWEGRLRSLRLLLEDPEPRPRYGNMTRKWKALAIITDSYDEWGQDKGEAAITFLQDRLQVIVTVPMTLASDAVTDGEKRDLLAICQKTGNALAADRTTKFFPVIVAQGFFIGTVAIAVGRTESAAEIPNPSTYINIEAHSIAFTALYFWIIPAVVLASVIGASQTENSIPRILQRFQTDIENAFPKWTISLPNIHLTKDDVEGRPDAALRERSGGIYSWQPMQSRNANFHRPIHTVNRVADPPQGFVRKVFYSLIELLHFQRGSPVLALIIVAAGTLTGFLISYLIPPIGFECRHLGEILIYEAWLLNAALDYISWGEYHRSRFWFTFAKDFLTAAATMGGIIATQVGVFNRCSCYTLWGKTGLALPEISRVAGTLVHRIATVYPAIAFLCVSFELVVFPALIAVQYPHAIRVFLQRDDNASNMHFWHAILDDWFHKDGPFYRRGARAVWKGTRQGMKRTTDTVLRRRTSTTRRSSSSVALLPNPT